MRRNHPFIIFFSISILLLSLTDAQAKAKASFWAPLTALEIGVLNNIESARSGDADSLLALALITSGDIRHRRSFNAIKKQIHQFIHRYRPLIDDQPSVYAKGEKLLSAMHDGYFTRGRYGRDSDLVDGYDAEQSSVSAIFQTGQFNCVSSAILYIILARYFDLTLQGVVTSQHAFVQIDAPNGRKIEVETTSKNGYGLVHDKRFYDQHFAAFSRSRNLEVPTYKDYLNRRVLSPFMLIVNNMNNQHTHATRMDKTTRHRLFEIQGYIDNTTAASQINRLGVYQNSMIELLNTNNSPKANALIRIIEPVVAQIKTRPWINDTRDGDIQVIWDRLRSIHTLWGHLLLMDKRYALAEHQYTEALQWAKTGSRRTQAQKNICKARAFQAFKDQNWQQAITAYTSLLSLLNASENKLIRQTRKNIVAAHWNWGNDAEQHAKWLAAAEHYGTLQKWADSEATIKKAQAAKARAHAMHHFKAKRWANAIQHFNNALAFQDPKQRAMTRRSIGSAYINWGNAMFNKKKFHLALHKYEAALTEAQKDRKKIIHKNVMAVYHRLTADLLKKKKFDEAAILLQPSAERFPNCTSCQREIVRLKRLAASQKKP